MPLNSFAPWGLRPVELADRPLLDRYLGTLREPLSDYTFSQVFTWRNSLRILWREIEGHLCVFANGSGDLTLLLPPVGDTRSDRALEQAFDLMDQYNRQHDVPVDRSRVEYVSEELLSRFSRSGLPLSGSEPMGADYLYSTDAMIHLAGGDLASKRQARNRFARNYVHRVEPYSFDAHFEGCVALLESWKQHQDGQRAAENSVTAVKRQKESLATELALRHAAELGLRGVVVYVTDADGSERIRGFTFGEHLGRDQASIVIEKTDLEVKGLAQFIFSEFCARCWSDRPLVNAGDDWGIDSLAWTKQSYRPVRRLNKYVLRREAKVQVAAAAPLAVSHHDPSPAVLVRAATEADLAAAEALEQTCFDTYSLTRRQLRYLRRNARSVFLVAEHEGALVGDAIALLRHQRGGGLVARLYSLAVRPECRGRKIGQTLLAATLAQLAARGARRVTLEVESTNASAIRLYHRFGFRDARPLPNYYGTNRSGMRMVCELTSATRAAA